MRCVVAIAETGSLTGAAQRLGFAQPALTQTLNRLEAELGTKLFVRNRRGAALTEAGLAIIDDLRASLAHADAANERARALGAGRAGRLTVGFVTHAVYEVMPRALRRLRAEHPQVDVVLKEMSNAEQVDALEGGRIDIALLHPPVSVTARVHERRLGEERMVVALPVHYDLPTDGRVSMAQVAAHGLVWFPAAQMPALRTALLGTFRSAGYDLRVVQDANRTLTVLACVAAGLGWSLLPSSVRALRHEGVRYAELSDGDDLPAFELSALWLARSRPTFADIFATMLGA
ncbi:DNA-binding transcriptional regulator, LysR family [Variovorax sp. HW608]|nr:DNA-binding transcriptional regulator, LysR family [Variovorax sp. HW608]